MARLITKKSTVAAKVPLATDLEIGELAVNTADAKIYTKHSDGNVVGMKAEPLAHTHTIADTPGLQAVLDGKAPSVHTHANATPGAAGFMSAQDKAKLDALSITVSATAPTNPNIGDLWVDTST